jgi:1-deoxy-D-xylulose-5-phosphate reductoisomerase
MAPKRIAILGSTGSIGRQALEVVQAHPGKFEVTALTAQNNADLLIEQALNFRPAAVVIGHGSYGKVKSALSPTGIQVLAGEEALSEVARLPDVGLVLTALVGYSGLLPTVSALEAGKNIALANKETLVVAGELITSLTQKTGAAIYPVDSEHSAIFQCMVGERSPIEEIILTASGGPFRGKKRADLKGIAREQALRHPNWNMGAKITIDSATLMNKGLEVMEARWLFGVRPSQVRVVIHPQSVIHSMVQFEDGSIKAQMGLPDMRLPIQYALTYPERMKNEFPRFDFARYPSLTFEEPDTETFRNLALAFEAMQRGGNAPCVLNAANEVAVGEFLRDRIGFLEMPEVVERCLQVMPFIKNPTLQDYVDTDRETRIRALEFTN